MSTFVVANWPPIRAEAQARRAAEAVLTGRADRWVFFGLLVSDDGALTVGVAGAADVPPDAARAALRDVLVSLGQENAAVEAHRWQHGGRPK